MTESVPDAPPRAAPAGWTGLATLALAALACMFSVLALVVAVGGAPPRVTTAAHAAGLPAWEVPRGEVPLGPDATRLLVAIELLLPQLPRPTPFPRAFAVAVALASDDAEAMRLLLPLAAAAAEGAPTPRQIAEGFGAAADAAVLAEMGFAPDAGWFARRAAATMRLGAEFGAAGTAGLAALREAGTRFAEHDLAGGEAALGALPAGTAAALGTWRAGLQRRIAADHAHAGLSALALSRARAARR